MRSLRYDVTAKDDYRQRPSPEKQTEQKKKMQKYLRNSKKSSTFAWKNEKTVIVHSAICLYAGDGDGYRLPFVVAGGNEYAGRKGGRDGG